MTVISKLDSIPPEKIVGNKIDAFCPVLGEKKYRLRLATIFAGGPPVIFSSQIHSHLFPAPLPIMPFIGVRISLTGVSFATVP